MSEKKQCAGRIYDATCRHQVGCSKGATLEYGGLVFCKLHHPPSKAERYIALEKKQRAESRAESQKRLAEAKRRALEEWALAWMREREPELVEKKESEP